VNLAVIGVGSNIDPHRHVAMARKALSEDGLLIAESRFVTTRPVGTTNQPDFLNGAFLVHTRGTLQALKRYLQAIETRLGRRRSADRFGPRTLDLDIVVWNNYIVHDDLYRRNFLRVAVKELLPNSPTSRRTPEKQEASVLVHKGGEQCRG